jgi:hypothetical protein
MRKITPLLFIPLRRQAGGGDDYDDSKLWEELNRLQSEQKQLAAKQEAISNIT